MKLRWILIIFGVALLSMLVIPKGAGTRKMEVTYNRPSVAEIDHDPEICKTRGLSLNARAALIVDNTTGLWLYAKRAQEVRPIASLTKLLTAMVYLDLNPNLDTIVYITSRDAYQSAKSLLREGEAFTARDLLHAALMSSDNRAARALATASGLARLDFVDRMNRKAAELGMMNTHVSEVTGLDERNVSTAADVAILVRESRKYSLIRKITSRYRHKCRPVNRKRTKRLVNSNRMVLSPWEVEVGKTGYIRESDYCLGTMMKDKHGKEITVIVLGSPTNNTRFRVARKLAQYGFRRAERSRRGIEEITS